MCHCIISFISGLIFLPQLCNYIQYQKNILNLLKFALPFSILIHSCRIGEWWIFKILVHLGGFSISCSKLHSADLFTFFHLYKSYYSSFWYNMYFRACIKTNAYIIQYFIYFHQDSYCKYDIDRYHQAQIQYFHKITFQHLLYHYIAG